MTYRELANEIMRLPDAFLDERAYFKEVGYYGSTLTPVDALQVKEDVDGRIIEVNILYDERVSLQEKIDGN